MEAEVGNQRHTPNSPKSETQSQKPRVTNPIQTSENINLPISSHNMSLPTSQLSTSRSLEICPSKLGSNYFQYLDTRSHLRPQITIPYPTRPIIFPRAQSTSLQLNTGQCHQPGDHPITNQGSHSGVQAGKSSLPEPNLYRPEEGQEMAPDIRSKGHKHLLTPSPFQDGVNQESHNNSSTRALYGSSGPEGCLPINSGFSILPEVSCIQMEGEGIRLSGNAFRPINCPQSFYQSNASTDHSLARTGTTYVSIPGRHSISFGLVHDSTILPRSYNLPPRGFGLPNKPREVSPRSHSVPNIPRICYKYDPNVSIKSNSGEGHTGKEASLRYPEEEIFSDQDQHPNLFGMDVEPGTQDMASESISPKETEYRGRQVFENPGCVELETEETGLSNSCANVWPIPSRLICQSNEYTAGNRTPKPLR